MATLDILNDDAFSVSGLTQTITDLPRVPTKIGDKKLFSEYGISTTVMMIERQGSSLKLVPAAPRGGVREPASLGQRKLLPISAIHLPQSGSVLADEVQGIRAFGKETEVEAVQALIKRKQAVLKANLDLTLEYHRMGAIKGLVLDADGTTPLLDMYALFNMTQQEVKFNINTAATTTDIKAKTRAVTTAIQQALGGRSFTGVRALVSLDFFDKLTGHNNMLKAWELWNQGQYGREQQNQDGFFYGGITYEVYAGGVGATDFIPSGTGYAYPEGVPGLFQTAFAPADYMETVNTTGLPYYSKQEPMRFNRGSELEAQSNPITFNTLPETVIKLNVAA